MRIGSRRRSVVTRAPWLCGLVLMLAPAVVQGQSDKAAPYTPPKTPWGDPDLQAIWSGDSAFGIPLQRPAALGNKAELTDAEFAEKVKRDERTRKRRGECGRLLPQRQLVADAVLPADLAHRRPAGRTRAAARGRAPRQRRTPQGTYGNGPLDAPDGLHALRPLPHARRGRLDDAEDLRQRLSHRAGARLRRDHGGDDPRGARDPARRPAARRRRRTRRISVTHAGTGKATRSSSRRRTSTARRRCPAIPCSRAPS